MDMAEPFAWIISAFSYNWVSLCNEAWDLHLPLSMWHHEGPMMNLQISFPYCNHVYILTQRDCESCLWIHSVTQGLTLTRKPIGDGGGLKMAPLNSPLWTRIFFRGHSSVWNCCHFWVIAQKITENGLWIAFDLTSELPGYSLFHHTNPEVMEFTFLTHSHFKLLSIWELKKTNKNKTPSFPLWQELACSSSRFWLTIQSGQRVAVKGSIL